MTVCQAGDSKLNSGFRPFVVARKAGLQRIHTPERENSTICLLAIQGDQTMKLKIGDPAPLFTATVTSGDTIKLADYLGQKVVLYFYPMDDTPGCTKQACSLSNHYEDIVQQGAAVLGVSTQDVESHQRFSAKYGLRFPLVADLDGAISKAYGAIGGGLLGGAMKLLGVASRMTFIIDESGHIAHVIDQPDCARHAEEVLALL